MNKSVYCKFIGDLCGRFSANGNNVTKEVDTTDIENSPCKKKQNIIIVKKKIITKNIEINKVVLRNQPPTDIRCEGITLVKRGRGRPKKTFPDQKSSGSKF